MKTGKPILDANEAAASVAFKLSEVIAIYPITPKKHHRDSAADADDLDDGSECCVIDHIKLHDELLIKVRFPSARTHSGMKPGD